MYHIGRSYEINISKNIKCELNGNEMLVKSYRRSQITTYMTYNFYILPLCTKYFLINNRTRQEQQLILDFFFFFQFIKYAFN